MAGSREVAKQADVLAKETAAARFASQAQASSDVFMREVVQKHQKKVRTAIAAIEKALPVLRSAVKSHSAIVEELMQAELDHAKAKSARDDAKIKELTAKIKKLEARAKAQRAIVDATYDKMDELCSDACRFDPAK